MHSVVITIPKEDANDFQIILDTPGGLLDAGRDQVIKTYTANFGNGIEADIKICNVDDPDSSPYIDAVLFQDGNEVAVLEPGDTLIGEYIFDSPISDEKLRVIIRTNK